MKCFHNKRILIILTITLLFISCEDPFTGCGPQPIYLEKEPFKPMLNILGVLRPDSVQDLPASFVHVEGVYSISTIYPERFDLEDALVKIYCYRGEQISDSLDFVYTGFDSIFASNEYRSAEFFPVERELYHISCYREGYFKLTGQTTVPAKPVIVNDMIQVGQNRIFFEISPDSLAALYDISLNIGEVVLSQRIRKPEYGNIAVTIDLPLTQQNSAQLEIYAYDLNLSEYLTYNISIKPNTYQGNYSTVENGYGCFGSLNILKRTIDL
jgi:hypothetical protein